MMMAMGQSNMQLIMRFPDGNRTYRLSTYKYSYNQLVFMPNAFRSAGTTQGTEVSVEQVLNRTSRSKTSVYC